MKHSSILEIQATTIPEQKVYAAKWNGNKIPEDLWGKIVSFMIYSYRSTGFESQLRLIYNMVDGQWRAAVFPQICDYLSVREDASDVRYKKVLKDALWKKGDVFMGTVHHHQDMPAYMSARDEGDERFSPGIHITLGNLDCEVLSIHARATSSYPRLEYALIEDLSEVLETPECLGEIGAWRGIAGSDCVNDALRRYFCSVSRLRMGIHPLGWEKMLSVEPLLKAPTEPLTQSRNPYCGPDWDSIRLRYLATGGVKQTAAEFNVSVNTLKSRMRREGWKRRKP